MSNGVKRCAKCRKRKALHLFYSEDQRWCRACQKAGAKKRYAANVDGDRDRRQSRARALQALRRRHPEEYNELFQAELRKVSQ